MQEFDATHRRLSDRVERVLMQAVILGLVAVVLVQTLALSPALRAKLNLLEGTDGYALGENLSADQTLVAGTASPEQKQTTPQAAVTPAATRYRLTVQLDTMRSAPWARLMVDGKAVADFSEGQATAQVMPGDLVAVDGSYYERDLTFHVIAAQGLESPQLGKEVTTRGDRQSLGVVRKRSH